MTVSNKALVLVAILSSVLCLPGYAAGQDTQLVTYREASPPTTGDTSNRPSWLKLPSLKRPTTTVAMPNFAQSFEKLGQGTQRLVQGTKNVLTPPKVPNLRLPKFKVPNLADDRRSKRPNLFSSLFKKESAEPEQPKTLNDWLALPRP